MPSNNHAVIAAAGSRKTQHIVDQALNQPTQRVLITTYTEENVGEITRRVMQGNGGRLPPNIHVMGWFTFLLNECARPYQRAVLTAPNLIRSFNFLADRNRYTARQDARAYFMDANRDVYRNGLAQLAVEADQITGGLVTRRLSEGFDAIYVDEVQDLVGWDLEFLDLLLASPMAVTLVGDPRQFTYSTNTSSKNKKYQGVGLLRWLAECKHVCTLDLWQESYRCNQEICDFADQLYPDLPATTSRNVLVTEHDGIFYIPHSDVPSYVRRYEPVILRHDKQVDTLGLLSAKNFGQSKGATYPQVLIFPTQPMLKYLASGDLRALKSKTKFYVAVTRAQYSVAFAVPNNFAIKKSWIGAGATALSPEQFATEQSVGVSKDLPTERH